MKRNGLILITILLFFIFISNSCCNVTYSHKDKNIITKALPKATNLAVKSKPDSELCQHTMHLPTKLPSSASLQVFNKMKAPLNSKAKIIAIDAGHQRKANNKKEPIGPGAKTSKPKVSSGTQGCITKVAEYKLNLAIALKVKKELIRRGYEVFMIRETNDVNISNKERAELANKSGADILIRIHADSSTNSSVHGASTLYPSKQNPYISKLSASSYTLSKELINSICKSTEAKNRGAIAHDDMSGINWSKIPVSIIEMGFMSNKKEDKLLQTKTYQNKIVKGICNGIDAYYEMIID